MSSQSQATSVRTRSKARRVFPHENGTLFPELSENPWTILRGRKKLKSPVCNISTVEMCAGAGGQALGLEMAGVGHSCLIEIDPHACQTLRLNRPQWNVIEQDLNHFDASKFKGVEIVSGGLPCPPFSIAGKQRGANDERNLFPTMIRLVDEVRPQAVMIENVRGILDGVFEEYRLYIAGQLKKLGYQTGWKLMNASDFGVPQLRPRVVFVALRSQFSEHFAWPEPTEHPPLSVGDVLHDLMASNGWKGEQAWRKQSDEIAPTIVGGSHKHGGPDLGPTRSRAAWAQLGVNGIGIADEAPARDFVGMPKLTVRMAARIQGFPDEWQFFGKKTAAYRQVGNAFPPPFAKAVAECIKSSMISRLVTAKETA